MYMFLWVPFFCIDLLADASWFLKILDDFSFEFTQMLANSLCRKQQHRVAFFAVDCRGPLGEIFVDLQSHPYVLKVRKPIHILITSFVWIWCKVLDCICSHPYSCGCIHTRTQVHSYKSSFLNLIKIGLWFDVKDKREWGSFNPDVKLL